MNETMQTSEVLDRAADLIEERGWWQDRRDFPWLSGGLCAANAIASAQDCNGYQRAYDALIAYLGVPDLSDIWRWNDEPDRTSAEVIEVLRACAVIEASREASRERQAVSA
jgi:hypothetical protein